MGNKIVYGAFKDKIDPAPKIYAPKAQVADEITWEQYLPAVFHQDSRGMCTGVTGAEICAVDAAIAGIIKPGLQLHYSPWWAYNGGRLKQGWLNQDDGAYPDDVFNWIVEHGLVRYRDWPVIRESFGDIKFDATDPTTKESLAIKYPDMVKSRIVGGVEGLIAALADGPVAISTPWFKDWEGYSSDVLPKITKNSSFNGRHEYLLYRSSKSKGTFFGENSWGTDWGILISSLNTRGGFEMDMESIQTILTYNIAGGYDAHDIDANYMALGVEPAAMYNLLVHSLAHGDTSNLYEALSKIAIDAGSKKGYTFNVWRPHANIDNPFARKTFITMMQDTEISAFFYKNKNSFNFFEFIRKLFEMLFKIEHKGV